MLSTYVHSTVIFEIFICCRISDFLMKVEALLLSTPQKEARRDITFSQTSHSLLKIPPKSNGPAYEIVAILDPTTRAAQKYTPVIMVGFVNYFNF
jgi:UDP-glucose:glycoprotein glucosyltransferase